MPGATGARARAVRPPLGRRRRCARPDLRRRYPQQPHPGLSGAAFMISFSHPAYLLLLLLVPGLILISRRSLADLRPGRARLALALRLGIALLLIAALAGLQVARPSKRLCVLFLLDQSDSIPRDRQEAAIRFINDAAARMGPNDTAGLIVFGSDAYVEYLPRLGLKVGSIHTV